VRRGEALWAIADRLRPEGVSVNQMMVAVYRANPRAFGGNMNVLRAGATLRLPDAADLGELSASVATAEVQKQSDEWLNRTPQQARTLRLLPPSDTQASAPATPSSQASNRGPASASPSPPASSPPIGGATSGNSAAEENRRLLEVRNEQLRNLQNQAAAPAAPAEKPAPAPAEAEKPAAPGVELENEPLFADEASKQDKPAEAAVETQPAAPTPAPAPAATAQRPAATPPAPSLVSQAIGFLLSPIFLIGVAAAIVIGSALLFVRRRRQQEPEDVTGRWEALESEVAEEEARDTARLRRQVPEDTIVVEESDRSAALGEQDAEEAAEPRRATPAAQRPSRPVAPAVDDTLSSQTVINLDQADPVAEADFHMAYGLYDQAAELVQKALDAAPNRRDLKLKLLEVFFVWGNKDAFLNAAQNLRKEIGQKADADWDKVVIMGKQICPDERLFAEATSGAGQVDVDLQAGDSPLDLAFDEAAQEGVDLDLGQAAEAFDLEATGGTPVQSAAPAKAAPKAPKAAAKPKAADLDGMLDIGERTAAGLESAFLDLDDDEDEAAATSPDISDSLAVTQESPTVERPSQTNDWAKIELEDTGEYTAADAPTVETPTIESARPGAATTHTRTVETPFRPEPPTVEQPAIPGADRTDLTAEIDLDDLGLDVKDLEGLPHDLGDLPAAADHETDTREQPELAAEDGLLSATGVTHVLHDEDIGTSEFATRETEVLSDNEATMLAPSARDTMTGTQVLEHRLELDETGSTSLVRALRPEDKEGLDLNLDDFTQALHGADTVEQPRTATFSRDVFGGGDTPLDMDIGVETVGTDDPTGTEEVSPLDPQTMTEVGTKLDLARAYIDMGDPEGARSILEEVLDEGDPGQRREAQGLIDVLSA
jgi:pilus assembly protein FimV